MHIALRIGASSGGWHNRLYKTRSNSFGDENNTMIQDDANAFGAIANSGAAC